MGRYSGKNLLVKNGTDTLDGVRGFDIEESVGDVDLTAGGDAWQDHDTGIPGWTGTITMLRDDDAAANQSLRAGDQITFEGYGEGSGTGKVYLSGTASVLSHKAGVPYDGEATREYSIKGKGALSVETVGA